MTGQVIDLEAARAGRASNSDPSLSTETGWCASAHGLDTVRLRWREPGNDWCGPLGVQAGYRDGIRGERYLQADGCRVGAFPGGHAYIEGRAAALLEGSESHRLVGAGELGRVESAAAERLAELGLRVTTPARAGRLDLTAELSFTDPVDGQSMLRALLHVDMPWLKAGGEGIKRESAETIYWRAAGRGRRMLRRTYDKGVESGIAGPGLIVRDEAQRRFRKVHERWLHDYTYTDLAALYAGRQLEGFRRLPTVVVCNRRDAITELDRLVDQDAVTLRRAIGLAGFLALGLPQERMSRATWYRYWADLRRLGLAIWSAQETPRRVDLGGYYTALLDRWQAA